MFLANLCTEAKMKSTHQRTQVLGGHRAISLSIPGQRSQPQMRHMTRDTGLTGGIWQTNWCGEPPLVVGVVDLASTVGVVDSNQLVWWIWWVPLKNACTQRVTFVDAGCNRKGMTNQHTVVRWGSQPWLLGLPHSDRHA